MRALTPGTQEWESYPWPSPAAAHRRAGSAACLGSTLQLTLLSGRQTSQPWVWERNRAGPRPLPNHVMAWVGGKLPPHPLLPVADERADSRVARVRELAFPLISCSTQESETCTLPGQHSRADLVVQVNQPRGHERADSLLDASYSNLGGGPWISSGQNSGSSPGVVSGGNLDLRTGEQENWPCSLLQAVSGELAWAMLETLGKLAGWPTRTINCCPPPTSTSFVNCWSRWRRWTYRSRTAGSPQHRPIGHLWGARGESRLSMS